MRLEQLLLTGRSRVMHDGDIWLLLHAHIDGHTVHGAVAVPARRILRQRHLTAVPATVVSEHNSAGCVCLVLAVSDRPQHDGSVHIDHTARLQGPDATCHRTVWIAADAAECIRRRVC